MVKTRKCIIEVGLKNCWYCCGTFSAHRLSNFRIQVPLRLKILVNMH